MFFKLINILAIAHLILSLLSLSLIKNNIIRKTNLLLNEKNNELVIAKKSGKKHHRLGQNFNR
jgi:hypothetical protein